MLGNAGLGSGKSNPPADDQLSARSTRSTLFPHIWNAQHAWRASPRSADHQGKDSDDIGHHEEKPVEAWAAIAKEHGIRFYTDAAQPVGKVATRIDELGVDLLAVAEW